MTIVFTYSDQVCYWIGGRRINSVSEWIDGDLFRYTNWQQNQPDGDGDCIDLLVHFDYKWNDAPCHAHCNFICKIT